MIVQCPQCKFRHRITDIDPHGRVVTYYCQACRRIVRIDLIQDELKHSSSSSRFWRISYRKKILVVDDLESVLEIVDELLKPTGYDVVFAKDGLAAVNIVKAEHPDLIILDLLLPKMTGLDVLKEVRKGQYSRETPVLVMSAVLKRTNEIMALNKLGANGFITKDALADNLLFRVNSMLANRSVHSNH